jgi:DNA-binding beta-propeller fold protein YncE
LKHHYALILAAFLAWPAAPAPAQALYAVDHRIDLPGDTGWDYCNVDAAARRLYLTRGQRVDVMDLVSERIIGSLGPVYGVHGVALAPDLGKGYISCGLSGTVQAFDLQTLALGAAIKAGTGPDAIVYEPHTQRVFAFNGKSHDATVIDARHDRVLATLPLDCRPEFAVADGQGTVYFNREDKDSIGVIDAQADSVTAVWALPAHSPSGLAWDAQGRHLFAVCDGGKMEVVDARSGAVDGEVAIGGHPDAAAYDPGTGLAFSSNGEGTVTVARADDGGHYAAVETLVTQKGARTLALDPVSHKLYLVCAQYLSQPAQAEGKPRHWPRIQPGSVQLLVLKKL